GGAAGFNSAAIARRLGCRAALLPEIGAALSAGGALLSDLVFTDGRICYVRSDAPDPAAIAATLQALTASAEAFLAGPAAGPGERLFSFGGGGGLPAAAWGVGGPPRCRAGSRRPAPSGGHFPRRPQGALRGVGPRLADRDDRLAGACQPPPRPRLDRQAGAGS